MKISNTKNIIEYIEELDTEKNKSEWLDFSSELQTFLNNVDDEQKEQKSMVFILDSLILSIGKFIELIDEQKNELNHIRKQLLENLQNNLVSKNNEYLKKVSHDDEQVELAESENFNSSILDIVELEKQNGGFKKEDIFNPQKIYDDLIFDISKKYPEYREFFQSLQAEQSLTETLESWEPNCFNYMEDIEDIDYDDAVSQIENNLNTEKSKQYYQKFCSEPGFIYACYDFSRRCGKVYEKLNIYQKQLGLHSGENITDRSCAIYLVASLLNEESLITKTRKVQTKIDDKLASGIFMQNPLGKQIDKLSFDDSMNLYDLKVYDNPKVLKQLANLQIIDFICSNTNRIDKSITYHFDQSDEDNPFLDCIQAIADSTCFANKVMSSGEKIRLSQKVINFRVIDYKMALKIMQLTKELIEATLFDFGFNEDIISYAFERVKILQEAIKKAQFFESGKDLSTKNITIIGSDDWQNISLNDLAEEYVENIFKTVVDTQKKLTSSKQVDVEFLKDVLIASQALENSVIRTDYELGEFYKELKNQKTIFSTPKEYKDILDKIEKLKDDSKKNIETDERKMFQDKIKKLGELKQLAKLYIAKYNS